MLRAIPSPYTVLLPLLLVLAGTPATADTDDWETFTSPSGRFSVILPTHPTEQRKEKWFPISSFVSTVYKSIVGHDVFGVNHTDIPRFAKAFASDERVFQSSREGFIEDSQAVEVSYRPIELLGRSGRELVYEIPAAGDRPAQHGVARMFFEGNRLYIFYAEVTDRVPRADVDRFLESFQLGAPAG